MGLCIRQSVSRHLSNCWPASLMSNVRAFLSGPAPLRNMTNNYSKCKKNKPNLISRICQGHRLEAPSRLAHHCATQSIKCRRGFSSCTSAAGACVELNAVAPTRRHSVAILLGLLRRLVNARYRAACDTISHWCLEYLLAGSR